MSKWQFYFVALPAAKLPVMFVGAEADTRQAVHIGFE